MDSHSFRERVNRQQTLIMKNQQKRRDHFNLKTHEKEMEKRRHHGVLTDSILRYQSWSSTSLSSQYRKQINNNSENQSSETTLNTSISLCFHTADQFDLAHDDPPDEITKGKQNIKEHRKAENKCKLLFTPSKKNMDIEVFADPLDENIQHEGSMKNCRKIEVKPTKTNGEIVRDSEVKREEENHQKKTKKRKRKDGRKRKHRRISEVDQNNNTDRDEEKRERATKTKDEVKESEDSKETNRATKTLKRMHLLEASAQETETLVRVSSLKKTTCDLSDIDEERGSRVTSSSVSEPCESVAQEDTVVPSGTSFLSSTSSVSMEDVQRFAFSPAPRDVTIRCRITRDRSGVIKGFNVIYCLHLEKEDGNRVFLMAARQKKMCAASNYLISTDPTNLSRDTNCYLGKLRSNVVGTKFTFYDAGENPEKTPFSDCQSQRHKLATISYKQNVLGFKGPRKMTVVFPRMLDNDERLSTLHDTETLPSCRTSSITDEQVTLINKSPTWDAEKEIYLLNFHGCIIQPSVKNFQLIHPEDEDYIVMQFGRVTNDVFLMEYTNPMSAVQAFSIALSSFDSKLACE
ncbi:tubby-related protein 3-like isoform X2 [Solea solea]|uniref:tubby-related protein 3-like isoform X2 n=1 Tax=Solea solea TaxID=90069 RepID=UPI00272A7A11|nr:tubby-related protein 3-like isoform X2 [Solea solea]